MNKIADRIREIATSVEDGEINALEGFIVLKAISTTVTDTMAKIKTEAVQEADKYGDKTFQAFGAQIEKRSGGGVWSYKHLEGWNELNDQKKAVEDLHKQAFKMIGQAEVIDPNTGEIIQPALWKPNAETISIKLL